MPSSELFNTIQFFPNGSRETIARGLPIAEAMDTACKFIARPAAKIGIIQRIIVTDTTNNVCFEWRFMEGITYPDGEVVAKWNSLFKKVQP